MFYGIEHEGKVEYKDIPAANEIAEKMVETNNFGFAVMQLSKYSNNSDEGSIRNVEIWYNNNTAQYEDFELNGKTIKLINTYHFSARKSSYDCFYEPVMNILFSKK